MLLCISHCETSFVLAFATEASKLFPLKLSSTQMALSAGSTAEELLRDKGPTTHLRGDTHLGTPHHALVDVSCKWSKPFGAGNEADGLRRPSLISAAGKNACLMGKARDLAALLNFPAHLPAS